MKIYILKKSLLFALLIASYLRSNNDKLSNKYFAYYVR